jgi:hypothetical protein
LSVKKDGERVDGTSRLRKKLEAVCAFLKCHERNLEGSRLAGTALARTM